MSYADELRRHQYKFTRHVGWLINFAFANGFELTFGEAYRTKYQQVEYLRTGRSKTLDSFHLKRLAIDFNIFVNGYYLFSDPNRKMLDLSLSKKLGEYWMDLSEENRWGADWDRDYDSLDETFLDPYHFERCINF